MARKQTKKRGPAATEREGQNSDTLTVRQGDGDYKVGPGCPPREHQFKPGESGNPDGPPIHRTNLWVWFTKYMNMTADERAKVNRAKLTAAQETALKMVEQAVKGRGCGFERLARYIVNREEGRAAEHIVLSAGTDLSDAECEEVRRLLRENLEAHADQRSKPV
jgi:hypothetical protein